MIRLILNLFPRPLLQRLAGLTAPLIGLFYSVGRGQKGSGHGVQCPLCGARYRKFMPYGYVETRPNALCPNCLALERHRLLWLWIERQTDLLQSAAEPTTALRLLHIAPEVCLSRKFEKIFPPENYVTADLESPLAKVRADVQALPFEDASFDVVMCNHVLEHVLDDLLAMRELRRVTRPGGWGVLLVPIDEARTETFEDDSITDPVGRTKIFGQYDHRRIYGHDYADRLRHAGWNVEEIDYLAHLTTDERSLYGLRKEILYIVHK